MSKKAAFTKPRPKRNRELFVRFELGKAPVLRLLLRNTLISNIIRPINA